MRTVPLALVAVLLVPGCRSDESFCDTVRALSSARTTADVDVRAGDGEATVRAKLDAFARANAQVVERQLKLLRRLERTAPADLKADVHAVVEVAIVFATAVGDGPDGAGGSVGALLDDPARLTAGVSAYPRVRAATQERCGVALDVAAADAAVDVGVNIGGVVPSVPAPSVPPMPPMSPLTVPPVPSYPVP